MKWIELISQVGEHAAGKFLEVEESVARSYIGAGLAKDGGDGPETVLLQRSLAVFRDELTRCTTNMAQTFSEATEALRKRPAGLARSGVEFSAVEGGESEQDKGKSVTDFFRQTVASLTRSMRGDVEGAAEAHKRLTEVYGVARSMTEGTGASLGYTTPVIYETQILKVAGEKQVFLANARRMPLGARQTEWPALDQYRVPSKGQSAVYGGVQVYRKGENVQRTGTDAATKKVVLLAQDLTCYMEVSRDALQDSSAQLDTMLPMLGGDAIGFRSDWEALNGTGVGQLFGLFNHPATIQITRSGGASTRFLYADAFAMFVRMLPEALATAAWYVHPFAMADVMKLKDESGRNVFLPVIPGTTAGPIAGAVAGTLLGRPVVITEKCSAPGTAGDVNFFSMAHYLYGERGGLEIGLSEHFRFDQDELAIRLKLRNDGKPALLKPIYLADGSGSNQVSAFVSLS